MNKKQWKADLEFIETVLLKLKVDANDFTSFNRMQAESFQQAKDQKRLAEIKLNRMIRELKLNLNEEE